MSNDVKVTADKKIIELTYHPHITASVTTRQKRAEVIRETKTVVVARLLGTEIDIRLSKKTGREEGKNRYCRHHTLPDDMVITK